MQLSVPPDERRGILLALVGMGAARPNDLLVRMMARRSEGVPTLLFWELTATSLFSLAWVSLWTRREAQWRELSANLTSEAWWMGAVALQCGTISIGVACLTVLFGDDGVIAVAPHALMATTVGSFWLGDAMPRRTAVALAVSSTIVSTLAVSTISMSLPGALLAGLTGAATAAFLCVHRASYSRGKPLNGPAAAGFGNLVAAGLVVVISRLAGASVALRGVPPDFGRLALASGLSKATIFAAMSYAPKYLTSAHLGLAATFRTALSMLALSTRRSVALLVAALLLLLVLGLHEAGSALFYRDGRELALASTAAAEEIKTQDADDLRPHTVDDPQSTSSSEPITPSSASQPPEPPSDPPSSSSPNSPTGGDRV
mmetsp:Transcript_16842/g.52645  ORF Transcript_16842/g.52645 Transcript_16842/m.52645 type:complete len:373 (+) Transcript_16842:149-1267(+)|eukprot:CAMPEP_0197391680 /NCGR_PEP_ID=MMETSP1165-20131217/3253_1 /TAXON_ID=284809 /ORGANISM="Chrysocystis fragilis, Strain CCMP3189" /LENGTH=372 /DNA_ID=CAMNT_0042917273 /DNA_START=122 /DNA_END=1240 /DNA_ORIENTATION=-